MPEIGDQTPGVCPLCESSPQRDGKGVAVSEWVPRTCDWCGTQFYKPRFLLSDAAMLVRDGVPAPTKPQGIEI